MSTAPRISERENSIRTGSNDATTSRAFCLGPPSRRSATYTSIKLSQLVLPLPDSKYGRIFGPDKLARIADESWKYLEIVPAFLHLADQVREVPTELPRSTEFAGSRNPPSNLDLEVVAVSNVLTSRHLCGDDQAKGVSPSLDARDHDVILYG